MCCVWVSYSLVMGDLLEHLQEMDTNPAWDKETFNSICNWTIPWSQSHCQCTKETTQ